MNSSSWILDTQAGRLRREIRNIRHTLSRESLISGSALQDWLEWILGIKRKPVLVPVGVDRPRK